MKNDPKKLIEHLTKVWENKKCPMCNKQNWVIGNNIFTLSQLVTKKELEKPLKIIPIIPLICSNCGNTILVNSFVSGITKPSTNQNSSNVEKENSE